MSNYTNICYDYVDNDDDDDDDCTTIIGIVVPYTVIIIKG